MRESVLTALLKKKKSVSSGSEWMDVAFPSFRISRGHSEPFGVMCGRKKSAQYHSSGSSEGLRWRGIQADLADVNVKPAVIGNGQALAQSHFTPRRVTCWGWDEIFSRMPSQTKATLTKFKYFSIYEDFKMTTTVVLSKFNVFLIHYGPFLQNPSKESVDISVAI